MAGERGFQARLPFTEMSPLTKNEHVRTLAINDRVVPYVLRRSARRSISLTIDDRGLRVAAPYAAPLQKIESFIQQHGLWIAEKLDAWTQRQTSPKVLPIDGQSLPFLGRTFMIARTASVERRFAWESANGILILRLICGSDIEAKALLQRALREEAIRWFSERVAYFMPKLGIEKTPELTLSSARTRWGSCSHQTGIRFNWRLIHFPPRIVDYVVAHELCHLHEMNHSAAFWALLSTVIPDYAALRAELNTLSREQPRW